MLDRPSHIYRADWVVDTDISSDRYCNKIYIKSSSAFQSEGAFLIHPQVPDQSNGLLAMPFEKRTLTQATEAIAHPMDGQVNPYPSIYLFLPYEGDKSI
jgi:hypothetical protein